MKFINEIELKKSLSSFKGAAPFDHCIIDNFFPIDIARKLSSEFLSYNDSSWFHYRNALEDKKALNDWNKFPPLTYKVFQELMDLDFLQLLEGFVGCRLLVDHGLHGGGWHIHSTGGNLNPHLDYSIHPKMGMLRKLNIIIYLSEELESDHGGHLGLWSGSGDNLHLEKEIQPVFNRAILFDTTQNSWHGMSRKLIQPDYIFRKSIAIYYLTDIGEDFDPRNKALFAPREDQKNDLAVQELIKIRSDSLNFKKAYRKE